MGCDGGDGLAGVLAAVGVLLVGEHLLDALHELGRGSLSLDVAVDELGDLDGGALGLIADLADGQLGHQLVEDGDGLLVLFLLSLGHDAGLVCVWVVKEGGWCRKIWRGKREKIEIMEGEDACAKRRI